MKNILSIVAVIVAIVLIGGSILLFQSQAPGHADPHGHEDDQKDDHADHKNADANIGKNGGTLLQFDDALVELTIFEQGVPPEFRLFVSDNGGHAIDIDPKTVSIVLARTDRSDTFSFRQGPGYLQSLETIDEPHEFGVSFTLTVKETRFDTSYFQEETHAHGAHAEGVIGKFTVSEEALRKNDVTIALAAPGMISEVLELPGEIVLNSDKVAHIVPRFPGIIQEVRADLGDRVNAGDVLAVVQSNQSVASYDVKSLIAGTVIEKHVTLGEFIRDDRDIYVVADLSTVWVRVSVYARYLPDVKVGQQVRISIGGREDSVTGKIDYLGPIVGERTRTIQARVPLNNSKGEWRPGSFVTARVSLGEQPASIAIPEDAIQTVEGKTVVFVKTEKGFEARVVNLGRSDGTMLEILGGLTAGESFVATNSFLLKAEFGKSEAGHEH